MKKPHIQWPEQWLRRKRIPSIGFSYSGKDFIISMSLYTLSVVLCLILRGASQNGDTGYVYMIFLLDVFLTALLTEGFFFSLIISIFAVLSVDYIFTPPYWNVSFTLSGFPLTFLVTMTISVVTGIVTSRAKQMDEVRREAELERMHGNLLRAVSHDIRTPLTGIVGATNVLLEQENTLTPEQCHELIRNANEEAQWLIRTVENLLSITRIGSDRTELNKQLEPVEEVLAEAVQKARKRLPDIKFSVEVPAELLMVPMDPILIEQVLSNLIENAVIHGKTTTAIHLQAEKTEDNFAAFSVRDNGQGISPALLPHLFDYSIRHASPPTGDGKRNMGLGLSVCSAVVKAHGGRLTAHNHPAGAEFIFCLPMPPADPAISTDLSEEETL